MRIFKNSIFALFALGYSICAFSQQHYLVSVETFVAGKSEDKFAFQMKSGDEQKKGFEARLHAKRYKMNGFRNTLLDYKRQIEKEDSQAEAPKKTQMEIAEEMLKKLVDGISKLRSEIDSNNANLDLMMEQRELLEKIIRLCKSNPAKMKESLEKYRSKYRIEEENPEHEKLFRRRPKNPTDYERIELGTYCELKLSSVNAKVLNFDIVYAFNRILTWIYVEKTNNNNTIGKLPVIEGFEKDAKFSVSIDEPFCIQFARGNTKDAKSLREALEGSSLFNMGGGTLGQSFDFPKLNNDELNAMGNLSAIRESFDDRLASTVRVVIKVSLVK